MYNEITTLFFYLVKITHTLVCCFVKIKHLKAFLENSKTIIQVCRFFVSLGAYINKQTRWDQNELLKNE
jgi:hypothetical protein